MSGQGDAVTPTPHSPRPAGEAERGRPSLRAQAYQSLKHQIITCVLRPGEYVNEARISELLNMGRTPVHQALDRLMVEGMVDIMPRKGVRVRPISLQDLTQITEVRLLNEPYCARLAALHAGDAERAALGDIVCRSEPVVRARDTARMITCDREFHAAIVAAARNDVLEDILLKLHDRSLRFWFISLTAREQPDAVMREHQRIVDAIQARRPDAADAAMRAHIESFRRNVAHNI